MSNHFTTLSRFGIYLFALGLPISHVPAQFGIALAVIGWMGRGMAKREWQFEGDAILALLVFYMFWNMVSSVTSPRPLHSLFALADNEWPLLIMVMMFWTIRDVNELKRIVHLFLASSSVAALYGIVQMFHGYEFWRGVELTPMREYFRSVGFHGFYLTFAGFMMSVVFLAGSLWFEKMERIRWGYFAVALVGLFAIVGTFARSIWLSFGAVMPILGFAKGKKIGLMVVGALAAILIVAFLAFPTAWERAGSIFDPSQNQVRLNLWKTALNMSGDHLIIGIGEDNWDYYFDKYKVEGFYDTTVHPHSDYLTVLVNAGIPGLTAFVGMWILALIVGVTTYRKTDDPFLRAISLGSTMTIFGFLIAGIFQNYYGTFINCLVWWFVVGLLLTAHRLVKEKRL